MRILITAGPMYGHVNTVLGLALAARRAGHQVVVATGADLVPHVERHGLAAWAVGPTYAEAGGTAAAQWVGHFATTAEKRAADLVPLAAGWRPDLVVHEETELAGPVAAAHAGARHVVHGLGLMPPLRIWEVFEPSIERLGRQWGVTDIGRRVRRAPYVDVCPAALQPAGERIWTRVVPLRPTPGRPAPGDRLPAALAELPYPRTIHLTLGTVFHDSPGVLDAAITGLRELPANLVVTAGPGADPDRFGEQPEHVVIEQYLPHSLLLPRCDLVVSQGGSGIMFGALANGLPQLVLPQGADQHMNADACRRAGAALAMGAEDVTAAAVAAAATRLLDEPGFRTAARSVQAEIAAMPDADEVVARLGDPR